MTSTLSDRCARLLDSVGRQAQRVVGTYDRRLEAESLADAAGTAVAATAAMGASALGLGALVTAVATTAAADVSGILAAGVIGAIGMLILPAKRRRARAELEVGWRICVSGSPPRCAASSWPLATAAPGGWPTHSALQPLVAPSRPSGPTRARRSAPGASAVTLSR